MAWNESLDLDEVVTYNTNSSFVLLSGGEGAHVQVGRADTPVSSVMVVKILGSIDGGTTVDDSESPWRQRRVPVTAAPVSIAVYGLYSFCVRIERGSGTDAVSGAVKVRSDGLNFD